MCLFSFISRYSESEGTHKFCHWLFEKYEEGEDESRLLLLAVLNDILVGMNTRISTFMAKVSAQPSRLGLGP